MRILILSLLLIAAALPSFAQGVGTGKFLPSTWSTPIGTSLAARQAAFANPAPGSAALIADIVAYTHIFSISRSAWAHRHCVATNADPLVTVKLYGDTLGIQASHGWNVLRIPVGCTPPGESDGHVHITNIDDPRWLWDMYGTERTATGSWSNRGMKRWARTKAAADSTPYAYDGDGRGIVNAYQAWTGATTACPASAVPGLGTPTKAEIDAGYIGHALSWVTDGERGALHAKLWPCVADGVTGGTTIASRVNAPIGGQRLMLDPSINVDALNAGRHMKILLKAAQEFGYVMTDSGGPGEGENVWHVEARDDNWAGYDFSLGSLTNDYIIGNSRLIPCVNAYPGECAGMPPPADWGGVPPVIEPPIPPVDPIPPVIPPVDITELTERIASLEALLDLYVLYTGPVRTATATTVQLGTDALATSNNATYRYKRLVVIEGTGMGQAARQIISYDGPTRRATVIPNFSVILDSTSVVAILP